MNKNKIIELTLKEIKEIETLVTGFGELEQIPAIMFQLADAKVENIRNILNLLTDETVIPKKNEPLTQEIVEKIVIQEKEPEIIEDVFIPEYQEQVVEEEEIIVVEEEEIVIAQEIIEEEITEQIVEEQVEPTVVIEEKEEEKKEEIAEEKEEPKPVVPVEKKAEKKKTIGERTEKKSSVNEKLSTKTATLNSGKISDLKKSISLNDKFRFQKELFKGIASLMNQTLEVLNETEDKSDALEFLLSFEWDSKNQTVVDFMELVNRKFL